MARTTYPHLTLTQARAAYAMGAAVILYCAKRDRSAWRFVALSQAVGHAEVSAPGVASWRRLSADYVPTRTNGAAGAGDAQRYTHKLAHAALAALTTIGVRVPKGHRWLASVLCQGDCGKMLVNPASVLSGMGPVCGGENDRRATARAAKRTAVDTFAARAAARLNAYATAEQLAELHIVGGRGCDGLPCKHPDCLD